MYLHYYRLYRPTSYYQELKDNNLYECVQANNTCNLVLKCSPLTFVNHFVMALAFALAGTIIKHNILQFVLAGLGTWKKSLVLLEVSLTYSFFLWNRDR